MLYIRHRTTGTVTESGLKDSLNEAIQHGHLIYLFEDSAEIVIVDHVGLDF